MKTLKIFLTCLVLAGCCKETLDTSKGKQVNISFDDGVSLASLYDNLDLFEAYNAKITYYVSNFNLILTMLDELQAVVDAGHEIGVHGYNHFPSQSYIEEHGLDQWLSEEVLRPIHILDSLGIQAQTYSYPHGSRNSLTDSALLELFERIRAFNIGYSDITPANDEYLIDAYSIDSHMIDLDQIFNSFDDLQDGETIFLASHIILENNNQQGEWYILRSNLELIFEYGQSVGINFVTVIES